MSKKILPYRRNVASEGFVEIPLCIRPYIDDGVDHCIRLIDGDILCHLEGYADPVECGFINAVYFDLDTAEEVGTSLFEMFDQKQEWLEFYESAIDEEGDPVIELMSLNRNLLLISMCGVYPEFRGQGLALQAIQEVFLTFRHGCRMVAMKPYPLQFGGDLGHTDKEKRLSLDRFSDDKESALKKLAQYYMRLGFTNLPETPYLYFDTGTSYTIQDFTQAE